jgi:4-amino-4-deoxy-L-arabinose transferase-like glycosyltransferase
MVDSIGIVLGAGGVHRIALPNRQHPREISLQYSPHEGSEPGAALIISNVFLEWNGSSASGGGLCEAIQAWFLPLALISPVNVIYVVSLVVGILYLSGLGVQGTTVWLPKLGQGWSWLFLATLLLAAFPSNFSPLTRLTVFGSLPLCVPFLCAVGFLTVRDVHQSSETNRHVCVVALLACSVLWLQGAVEVGERQPRDIDEIVYVGVARNLVDGRGFVVPDSAYKTRNLEHIDPIRKLWWKNELYLGIARKGQPTAAVPPLFSLFLSPFVSEEGVVNRASYIFQGLLGLAGCIVLYVVGVQIVGHTAAIAALLLVTTHAPFSAISRYLFTESLFLFFVLLSVLLLVWFRRAFLAGCCIALASLTRSVALVLVPAWVLFSLCLPGRSRLEWKKPALLVAGFLIVVAPWGARNLRTVGEATIGSTFTGKDLFIGNNDRYRRSSKLSSGLNWGELSVVQKTLLKAAGAGREHVERMFEFPVDIPQEAARSTELRRRAIAFMVAYPRPFLKLTWKRALQMLELSNEPVALWSRTGHLPFLLWPILFLAPIGLVWGSGRLCDRLFLLGAAVLTLLPPLVSVGFPRYRLPFDLLLCPLAGAGLQSLPGLFPAGSPPHSNRSRPELSETGQSPAS